MAPVDRDPTVSVIPSFEPASRPAVSVAPSVPASATAVGIPVARSGPVADAPGLSRERLAAAGFTGEVEATCVVAPAAGPMLVAFETGEPGSLDAAGMRDAAAGFARAASGHAHLRPASRRCAGPPRCGCAGLESLTLVADAAQTSAAGTGARRGAVFAWARSLARDLVNTPHSHMNATRMAELGVALGKRLGFGVEVFDEEAPAALGCGGLLRVNAGSAEPPRMVKLTYRPAEGAGHLGMGGKGIMYDSGGISLEPSDPIHAQMRHDRSGAATVLARASAVAALAGSHEPPAPRG